MTTNAQWEDVAKVLTGIVLIGAAIAVIKLWVTPSFRSFIFRILDDEKDGWPILIAINQKIYKDRIGKTDRFFEIVDDLEGRMEASEQAVTVHSKRLSDVELITGGVPEMNRILTEIKEGNEKHAERFERSMDRFTDQLGEVKESVARIEGRWDGSNRRKTDSGRE